MRLLVTKKVFDLSIVLAFILLLPIYSFSETGDIFRVAGTGESGYSGDGGDALDAKLDRPEAIYVDTVGNMYISDFNNNVVRKVDTSGVISTIAGTGTQGYSGDGGPATSAKFYGPRGMDLDKDGNIYIADTYNNRVRKIDASTGYISTIAGNGIGGYSGDGGAATSARLYLPYDVDVDSVGNIYIADKGNSRIRKVDAATGNISTVAGNGTQGYSGDGGPATSAKIDTPHGIFIDIWGSLFIADSLNDVIRKVDASSGNISTVAGNGNRGFSGDGGPALLAELSGPIDIHVDAAGNIYIADFNNAVVRKVNTVGYINTIAGTGTVGYSGDGDGSALNAEFNMPRSILVHETGSIYITDCFNNVIRKIYGSCSP